MKKNQLLLLILKTAIVAASGNDAACSACGSLGSSRGSLGASGVGSQSNLSLVSGSISQPLSGAGLFGSQLPQVDDANDLCVRLDRSVTHKTVIPGLESAASFVSAGSEKPFEFPKPPTPRVGGEKLVITSSGRRAAVVPFRNWFLPGRGLSLLFTSMDQLPLLSSRSLEIRKAK